MKAPIVLLAALLVACLYPAYQHELQRWDDCFDGCAKRYASNARILVHPMCADPFQRHAHGEHAETMCRQAERENVSTPTRCAWRKFWHEGEFYGVYRRFAHEPWMLYGMALPISLFVVYMCFSVYQNQRAESRKERERAAMLGAMKDMYAAMPQQQAPRPFAQALLPPPPAAVYYTQRGLAVGGRRRKRTHYHNNGKTQIELM